MAVLLGNNSITKFLGNDISRKHVFEKINLDENKALLLLNHLNKISNYLELAEMYDIKNV